MSIDDVATDPHVRLDRLDKIEMWDVVRVQREISWDDYEVLWAGYCDDIDARARHLSLH